MALHISQVRSIHFVKDHQFLGVLKLRINMKYLGIALLIAAAAVQVLGEHISEGHSRSRRSYGSQLQTFLDVKLRKLLKEGNATLGFPIMDPLDKPELGFELNEEKAKGSVSIKDLHVEGLAGYTVDAANVRIYPTTITVDLTFPEIKASGNYSMKGVVMDGINIYGTGEFQANIRKFSVKTVVSVNVFGGMKINSMKLEISLGGLQLNASGIFDDENTSILLSEIISDMAPQLIADYHEEITTKVSAVLVEIGNVLLKGKTINDINTILG
ncbi:uncharacterized protein LOC135163966 [Diachasmimorpha longicaudata]|uniref:uncharacterized protein LOC135163966 n=1 Tax=Diachasmimorpha longicaudata TaxID=58733 RepID=UPI0030B89430